MYFLISAGGEPGVPNPIQYLLLFVIQSVDFLEEEDYAQVFGGDCQAVLAYLGGEGVLLELTDVVLGGVEVGEDELVLLGEEGGLGG